MKRAAPTVPLSRACRPPSAEMDSVFSSPANQGRRESSVASKSSLDMGSVLRTNESDANAQEMPLSSEPDLRTKFYRSQAMGFSPISRKK